MGEPKELDFYECANEILHRLQSRNGGVLCTVVDSAGSQNVLTLGWGLIGPNYHGHPIFAIAVPGDDLRAAADLCGTKSGRDLDKFEAARLTSLPSVHVKAPSVLECPINVECRVYTRVAPPHLLLTPEHRQRPLEQQHTIYFAEVLGTYRYS